MIHYIYLHGFASSPQSQKAQYLRDRFDAAGLNLVLPDLNQDDFFHLTLTRQIQQVQALLPADGSPVTVIGSSFGGLTAAWLGDRHPQIQQLVLLAPAFQFVDHWRPRLGEAKLQQWQADGTLPVYHYTEAREVPLSYDFMSDITRYSDQSLQRPVPTLIVHGRQDDVIPVAASQDYARDRPWVELIELESDHALGDVQPEIWAQIQRFCQIG